MMNSLERMDARLHLVTQAELIASWLQGDHGLSKEKEASWRRLSTCLTRSAMCLAEMEDDMLRSRSWINERDAQARSDAELIGSLKAQVEILQEENSRIKENLAQAIDLLNSNHINQTQLWRT